MAAAPTNASLPHIHGLFTVWIVRVEIHKPPRIISHRLGSADHSRPQKQLCSVVEVSGHVGVIDFIGLGKDKYRGRPDVYLELDLPNHIPLDRFVRHAFARRIDLGGIGLVLIH